MDYFFFYKADERTNEETWVLSLLYPVDSEGNTTPLATLQPREAAELGRVLSRSTGSTEDTRKQMLFEEFCIEWVALDESSQLIGQTLQQVGTTKDLVGEHARLLFGLGRLTLPLFSNNFKHLFARLWVQGAQRFDGGVDLLTAHLTSRVDPLPHR